MGPRLSKRVSAALLGTVAAIVAPLAFAQASGAPETFGTRSVVVVTTAFVVIACIILHYEALTLLTRRLRRIQLRPRPRILVLIFAILFTHVLEIWIFGIAYYLLTSTSGHGALIANYGVGFLDHVYFSAVIYSTLGLGDIAPLGAIRFLVGTEALTGFVLVTWSASFTFVEMERFWRG